MLDEVKVSRAILERGLSDLKEAMTADVIMVGAGPSGLTGAYYLAKNGVNVVLFERALKPGGGMPGGGIGFPVIVVQEEGLEIIEELDIKYKKYSENYYTACSLESTAKLTSSAIDEGVKIFNLTTVEDLIITSGEVRGVVINRTAIEIANLHIDPISARSKFVCDATGHDTDVVKALLKRKGMKLNTPSGVIEGEGPMCAEIGEGSIVENTREVFPNLYVTGMAANAVFGAPRMGPIFGGMLLSGRKVASLILKRL